MNRPAMLAALFVVSAGPAQDPGEPTLPGPKQPPKKETCCEEGRAKPWPGYNQGVKWIVPPEKAALEARKSGKLLMVFHLVGDMDKEGC